MGFLEKIRDLIDRWQEDMEMEDITKSKDLMTNLVQPLRELIRKWRSGMCEKCLPNYRRR